MIAFTRSKRTQAEIIVITGNLSAAIKGKCGSVLRIDQEYADSITKEYTLRIMISEAGPYLQRIESPLNKLRRHPRLLVVGGSR